MWFSKVISLDFGSSLYYKNRSINEVIKSTFSISSLLGTLALLTSLGIGLPLGCWSGWKSTSPWSQRMNFFFLLGTSVPSYFIAILTISVFAIRLQWFPPVYLESPSSWILPVFTLSWKPTFLIIQLARQSVIECLHEDYIRTARGKGLSEYKILFKHVLKNSIFFLIPLLSPLMTQLVTGSFLVESIFQIPGLGKYFIQSILNRDYPLIMACSLLYGSLLVFFSILIDLVYTYLDPRIEITKL